MFTFFERTQHPLHVFFLNSCERARSRDLETTNDIDAKCDFLQGKKREQLLLDFRSDFTFDYIGMVCGFIWPLMFFVGGFSAKLLAMSGPTDMFAAGVMIANILFLFANCVTVSIEASYIEKM